MSLLYQMPLADLSGSSSPYAQKLSDVTKDMDADRRFCVRVIVALALAPYISPQLLDPMAARSDSGSEHTEYGRFRTDSTQAFIPTVQTALFLLSGNELGLRFQAMELFRDKSPLISQGILSLTDHPTDNHFLTQRLAISPDYQHLFTTGQEVLPSMNGEFPAQHITTPLQWDDLILPDNLRKSVDELLHWLELSTVLMQDPHISRKIKPGFRALFHGPPGTGKTMTAMLLGKTTGRPVFRVDLSMLVSKYIGETEKNLARLFDRAANKNWILFFDEADALFGKRTSTQTAHDRYANQEVAYLLQRIEDYPGLVILASNLRSNIDKAFSRRFQSIIHFPEPRFSERYALWEKAFPPSFSLDDAISLTEIATKYELTGAQISNIVQTCCLSAMADKTKKITLENLLQGILKEYQKDDRVFKA